MLLMLMLLQRLLLIRMRRLGISPKWWWRHQLCQAGLQPAGLKIDENVGKRMDMSEQTKSLPQKKKFKKKKREGTAASAPPPQLTVNAATSCSIGMARKVSTARLIASGGGRRVTSTCGITNAGCGIACACIQQLEKKTTSG
jgi:hypothetical protein